MTWIRISLSLSSLIIALALPSYAQQTPPPASPDSPLASPDMRKLQTKSGTLRLFSANEADIDGIDSNGQSSKLVFVVNSRTKCDPAKVGDTVSVIYVVDGSNNTAVKIVARTQAPGAKEIIDVGGQGGVGGTAQGPKPASDIRAGLNAPPATSGTTATASNTNTPASIQQKLEAEFTLSKATADKSNILTAGSVLILEKDGLLMSATPGSAVLNTYKDGKISQSPWGTAKMSGFASRMAHSTPGTVPTRTFVAGEKFLVTNITVHDDGVILELLSDTFSDVRYSSILKFPFAKGALPSPDQADSNVGEVVKVQPAEAVASDDKGARQPAASAASAATPMAPIAAPPPPADASAAIPAAASITLGETIDEVTASFGKPTSIVDLGTRTIYVYKDMKVTFKNGKVSDVQ
jgi:hypothetical protein